MTGLDDSTLDHLRVVVGDLVADSSARATPYELLEEIGRGGTAVIHRAHDHDLARDVALKVIARGAASEVAAGRLLREARILAHLEHPGIVPVHDVGTLDDGRVFAAMKLVRGRSLASLLGETGPAGTHLLAERLRLFLKILEAVGFAHSRGVVHCDLKPANVMVGAFGEVLVMDWGLAQASSVAGPAEAASVQGTPGYMAPEQERGDRASLDARADVFALGTILLDLLRGLGRQPALRAIAERARAAAARDRYADVAELAVEIERFLAREAVSAYREPPIERLRRWYARYEAPILLVAAYLLLRVLFAIWPRG